MSGTSGPAARFEALETKVAHLERTTQELSDVLYRQQRELDALTGRLRQLLEQAQSPQPDAPDAATRIEIPPHY
jgi:SlyX protein